MELWLESLLGAWHTMRANPLRSFLTSLTVAIGAGAMTLLAALADSALATILDGVEAVGGRELIFLESKKPKGNHAQSASDLTLEDAESLRSRVPGLVDLSYVMSFKNQDMLAAGKKADVDIAVGEAYQRLLLQEIELGHGLSDASTDRSVVLSKPVAEKLFGSSQAALHQSVLLWNKRYRVVGVTRPVPKFGFNMGGASRHRAVFLSSSCVTKTEGIVRSGLVVLHTDKTTDHDLQIGVASSILGFRHRGVDDHEFFDFRALIQKFDTVFSALRIIVSLIGAVSLVIAGAGIMNVMMASVRARVTEIGVRRALGANQTDILRQFLVESVVISATGGAVGTAASVLLSLALGIVFAKASPAWINRVPVTAPLFAFVCSVFVGVFFGMKPAQRGARLDIVACLRGESA